MEVKEESEERGKCEHVSWRTTWVVTSEIEQRSQKVRRVDATKSDRNRQQPQTVLEL